MMPVLIAIYERYTTRIAKLIGEVLCENIDYAIELDRKAAALRPFKRVPRFKAFVMLGISAAPFRRGW